MNAEVNVTDETLSNADRLNSRNGQAARAAVLGECPNCGKYELLAHLHGDRGGPLYCIHCGMDWHGKHGRRRNAGRIVIKALKAYFEAGGQSGDIEKLKLAAWGVSFPDYTLAYDGDKIGTELPDLTTELLKDVLQLPV